MYDEFLLPSSLKSYNSDQSFSDQCSHISMLLLLLLLLLSMLLKYVAYLPALSRAAFLAIQPDIFIWRYFLKAENADLYGTQCIWDLNWTSVKKWEYFRVTLTTF